MSLSEEISDTVLISNEVSSDAEMTPAISYVKWCHAMTILMCWITMFLSDEVLGNVEMTITTSLVKWCIAIIVLT